jgi:glutathione S-transferase
MGAQFTLADVVMAPYVERLDHLTLSGLWNPARPRVGKWFRRLRSRPSFAEAFDAFQPLD